MLLISDANDLDIELISSQTSLSSVLPYSILLNLFNPINRAICSLSELTELARSSFQFQYGVCGDIARYLNYITWLRTYVLKLERLMLFHKLGTNNAFSSCIERSCFQNQRRRLGAKIIPPIFSPRSLDHSPVR